MSRHNIVSTLGRVTMGLNSEAMRLEVDANSVNDMIFVEHGWKGLTWSHVAPEEALSRRKGH